MLIFIYFTGWTPYAFMLLVEVCNQKFVSTYISNEVKGILYLFAVGNSVLNPFIHSIHIFVDVFCGKSWLKKERKKMTHTLNTTNGIEKTIESPGGAGAGGSGSGVGVNTPTKCKLNKSKSSTSSRKYSNNKCDIKFVQEEDYDEYTVNKSMQKCLNKSATSIVQTSPSSKTFKSPLVNDECSSSSKEKVSDNYYLSSKKLNDQSCDHKVSIEKKNVSLSKLPNATTTTTTTNSHSSSPTASASATLINSTDSNRITGGVLISQNNIAQETQL